jgi:hypothetical protein
VVYFSVKTSFSDEEQEAMKFSGWRGLVGLLIPVAFFLGCTVPPSAAQSPLSATAAQQTLDSWNPSYCKVAEFYGLYKPEAAGATQVTVLIANPGDKAQRPAVYAANFQLTRPDGRHRGFDRSRHPRRRICDQAARGMPSIPVKEAGRRWHK